MFRGKREFKFPTQLQERILPTLSIEIICSNKVGKYRMEICLKPMAFLLIHHHALFVSNTNLWCRIFFHCISWGGFYISHKSDVKIWFHFPEVDVFFTECNFCTESNERLYEAGQNRGESNMTWIFLSSSRKFIHSEENHIAQGFDTARVGIINLIRCKTRFTCCSVGNKIPSTEFH